MLRLAAPWPNLEVVTWLPNAEFGDSQGHTSEVQLQRTMDGNIRTHTKSKNNRQRFVVNFVLAREKAMEIREFFRAYHSHRIHLTINDKVYIGNFLTNPFSIETAGRAMNFPGNTVQTHSFEFEGVRRETA